MKEINVKGRVFQYEILHDGDEIGDSTITCFYEGTEKIKYKKYYFFGEEEILTIPKLVFKMFGSIEDNRYTKDEMRESIERKVELLNRQEEINKGDII